MLPPPLMKPRPWNLPVVCARAATPKSSATAVAHRRAASCQSARAHLHGPPDASKFPVGASSNRSPSPVSGLARAKFPLRETAFNSGPVVSCQ